MQPNKVSSSFGAADSIVFASTLVISAAIGVYFAWKDRTKKSVENYYFGGRKLSPAPLGLSIAVTFISAVTVLGFPAEAYFYGLVSFWYGFTLLVPTAIACLYYIPLIHRLEISTIYEYLEMRFHPIARKISSAIEIVNSLAYMGTVVYLPALALNAVTPLKLQWSILLTSGICTLYTTFGGIKAVIWTDTFQAIIMLIGVLAVLIKSTIVVGGFGEVWKALERGQRLNMFEFDPDPSIRITFWTLMVGTSVLQSVTACINQSVCQRYLSCKSIKDARKAACFAIVPKIVLSTISVLCGCVAYAYFEGCDPLKSGKMTKTDQMMPNLALEVFQDLPGLTGFYVAAAYAGTLSTVSSGINSVSVMILNDFILLYRPRTSHIMQLIISKTTVVTLGVIVTGLAYLASVLPGTIISLVFSIRAVFGGPTLGIYTLGIFFPWCNTVGALIGQFMGIIITAWIVMGSMIYGKSPESQRHLPVSIDYCPAPSTMTSYTTMDFYENFTTNGYANFTTGFYEDVSTLKETPDKTYSPLYAVSFMYYSSVGLISTIIIGMLVSVCTGLNKPKDMNPKLFLPIVDNSYLPDKVRCFFRFGVPELETKYDSSEKCKEKDEKISRNSEPLLHLDSRVQDESESDHVIVLDYGNMAEDTV